MAATKGISQRQRLYFGDVERLLKRRAHKDEIEAIKLAFSQQRDAIETASRLTGTSASIDRQNDVA